jgi:hypothetical protein
MYKRLSTNVSTTVEPAVVTGSEYGMHLVVAHAALFRIPVLFSQFLSDKRISERRKKSQENRRNLLALARSSKYSKYLVQHGEITHGISESLTANVTKERDNEPRIGMY